MLQSETECLSPPAQGFIGLPDLTVDVVDHEFEEFCLAADVGVEAHRSDPKLPGELAHRQGFCALFVCQSDSCGDYRVDGETEIGRASCRESGRVVGGEEVVSNTSEQGLG